MDDLDRVLAILQDCGYSEDRFYIHVDGALFGMMGMLVWLMQRYFEAGLAMA